MKNYKGNLLTFASSEGRGEMDYGIKGLGSGDLQENTFYIRGKTAYNVGDIGNYLWGRGMAELGFDYGTVQIGSHVNNACCGWNQKSTSYDFGPGTYGSWTILDSPGDQRAIKAGFYSTPKGAANDKKFSEGWPGYHFK